MSKKDENKPTTQTQKIIIILISVVMILLLAQLLITSGSSESVDRETCLERGDIWSQSTQECYQGSSMGMIGNNGPTLNL